MRNSLLYACVVALGLVACSIENTRFQVGDQSGDAGEDAPPSGPIDFVVSASSLTVTEGMTKPLAISLSGPPQGSLLVTVEVSDDTRLGIAPTAVLFSPTDWATPQEITLTGRADADTSDENVTVTLRSTAIASPKTIEVTVDDDDGLALAMTPSSLDVGEGSSATIEVHLTAMPLAPVTVAIVSGDTQVATVSDAELVFTPSNYAIDQELTISGMQDADVAPDLTAITFTSPDLTTAEIEVQVTDDDILGIAVSESSLTLPEDGTRTFTVQLTQQPVADIDVTVASAAATVATASPATLTFTSATWSTPQTVTVAAVADDDVANNATDITLAATGLVTRTVAATITDDDVQGIVLSPTTVNVTEGQAAGLGVKLAYKPAHDITIAASSLAPTVASVSPATLTFSPSNYGTNQILTISGAQDADAADGSTSIHLDAGADGLTADAAVNVDDDDTLAIDVSTATVAAAEGGTGMFMVKLTAQPAASTTVTIASSNSAIATTAPTSLSFTTSNWSTAQAVTVTGVQDNDLADEAATLTLSAPGATNKTVTVNVNDDDAQAIVASTTTTTVTEGGTTTVGVKLAFQPAANVTVNVVSGTPAAATVSPAALTFTSSNWSTSQSITISGVEDANTTNGSSTIALSSSGLTTVNIAAAVTDNDTLNIDLSPTTLVVAEGGTGTLSVRLTAQPAASTTVTLSSNATGSATVSPASLTFSTANWSTAQSVTVTGVSDADTVDDTATITAASTGLSSRTAAVTVNDDDVLKILVSAASVAVNEGSTVTFQVKLSAQPPGTTSVAIATNNAGAATASPTPLSFTTSNYATYQTVTVTGVNDADVADENVTFTLSASGATGATVTAAVNDNDTQAVVVSPTSKTVAEGATGTFTVKLAFQPSASTTVNVASSATGIATVSPATLTFSTANYATAQTVTITGAQDANAVTNTATVTASSSGATSGTVAVTVTDNDTLGITITPTTLTVAEGATGTIKVKLTAQPSATTTVAVATADSTALSRSPTSLSFTTANWDTYQNVTVTGVQDSDYINESVAVTFTSSGLTTRTATVTLDDDETAPPVCGDGICNGIENECRCPEDCGFLLQATVVPQPLCECGDGICSNSELLNCSCQIDCAGYQCY